MKLDEVNSLLKSFSLEALSPSEEFGLICSYLQDFIDKIQTLNMGYVRTTQSFLQIIQNRSFEGITDFQPTLIYRAREDTPKLIKFYFVGYKLKCTIYAGEVFRRLPVNVRVLFKRVGEHYTARLKSSELNVLYMSLI